MTARIHSASDRPDPDPSAPREPLSRTDAHAPTRLPGVPGGFPRRTLLQGAAALALSKGALARQGGKDNRPPERTFKKSLKFAMVESEGSVLEKFQLIKRAGFDGVDIESPTDADPDELLAAKEATGLAIPGVTATAHWTSSLGHPDPEVRAEGRLAVEAAIGQCKLYGGSSVLLVPAVVNKDICYQDAWERSVKEIELLLPHAERMGIRIGFENANNHFLLSPLEAARYVDAFDSEFVGWHFDIANALNSGWPEQWIRILGRRIMRVDVRDFSRTKRDSEGLWRGFDVKLGDGDCDWPEVMRAFDEIGYRGWMTAEGEGGGEGRLLEIVERMERVLAS